MKEENRKKVMQALEVCVSQDCYSYDRTECPFYAEDNCVAKLKKMALELLREDEETADKLRAENRRLHRENFWLSGAELRNEGRTG